MRLVCPEAQNHGFIQPADLLGKMPVTDSGARRPDVFQTHAKACPPSVRMGCGRAFRWRQTRSLRGRIAQPHWFVMPASEVDRLRADNRQAQRLLDWNPQVDLDEGLKRSITWVQENASLYKPQTYTI